MGSFVFLARCGYFLLATLRFMTAYVTPGRYARLKVGALADRLAGEERIYRLGGQGRQDACRAVCGYLGTEAIGPRLPPAVVQRCQAEVRSRRAQVGRRDH